MTQTATATSPMQLLEDAYSTYVKTSVRKGTDPLNPNQWIQRLLERDRDSGSTEFVAEAQAAAPNVEETAADAKQEEEVRSKFKELMITEGHGSVMERAHFRVLGK